MKDTKRTALLRGYSVAVALSLFYLVVFGNAIALVSLIVGAVFTECLAAFIDKSKGD
jgi:hypothetical protein